MRAQYDKRRASTMLNEEGDFTPDEVDDRIEPKLPTPDDWDTLEDDIEEVLTAFGWDMTNPSIESTPKRFLNYLREFHQPFNVDDVLGEPFDSPDNAMVIQDGIPFRMICEHHLLPAIGRAAIGYMPNGKVVGLSKLTRIIQAVGTEKPSLQEHISHRCADLLEAHIKPKGVMLVVEAEHGCMACRGVNVSNVITRTSIVRGVFFTDPTARAEFLAVAQLGVGRRG